MDMNFIAQKYIFLGLLIIGLGFLGKIYYDIFKGYFKQLR